MNEHESDPWPAPLPSIEVVNALLAEVGAARRKRRFAEPLDWAVLLSVLLHVLILAIQFGTAGSGKALPPSSTPPMPVSPADSLAPLPPSPDIATATSPHLPPGEFVVTLAPRKPVVQPAPTKGTAILPPKRRRTGTPVMTAERGKWRVATQGRVHKLPPPTVANAELGPRNVDTPADAPTTVDDTDRPVMPMADAGATDGAPTPPKPTPATEQEKPQAPQPSAEDIALAQQKHDAELAAAVEEKRKAEAQAAAEKTRAAAEALAKREAEEAAERAKQAAVAAAEQAKAQAAAEAAHKAEAERIATEQRKAEEARKAAEAQKADEARKQAEQQLAEVQRQREAQRQAEAQRKLEEQQRAEAARKQEAQRQAEEQARQDAARKQEAQRLEAERLAEERHKADELRRIDAQRIAAEQANAAKGADRSANTTGQGSGPGVGNSVGEGRGAGSPDKLGLHVPIEAPPQLSLAQRALQQLHNQPAEPSPPSSNRGRRGTINNNTPPADDLAFYGDGWSVKVARVASLNPLRPSERSSDHLVIGVVINSDGSLKDVYIVRSSGDPGIDLKARHIVEMSAPFSPFAERMRNRFDEVEITRTWIFAGGVSRLSY